MKKEHIIIPVDQNDEEDFDVSQEALDRAQRMRREHLAREGINVPIEEMKQLHAELEKLRGSDYRDLSDEEIAVIIDDLYDGL